MRPMGLAICVTLAAVPLAASVAAYRDGPLPAMTGGFGESSCRTCHFDHPLNDRGGSLTVAGIPARYQPGQRYAITVALKRPGLRVGGFEMTARIAAGPRAGEQAGSFEGPAGTRIVFAPGLPVQYLQHTKAGSLAASAGATAWTLHWTAPANGADAVSFNVAANASNDDDSPLGDYIYTSMLKSQGR